MARHRILQEKYCQSNRSFIKWYYLCLRHLGLMQNAAVIENALLYTLEQGIHTGDFGDKNKPSLNTTQFAEAIIGNFGKEPKTECKSLYCPTCRQHLLHFQAG